MHNLEHLSSLTSHTKETIKKAHHCMNKPLGKSKGQDKLRKCFKDRDATSFFISALSSYLLCIRDGLSLLNRSLGVNSRAAFSNKTFEHQLPGMLLVQRCLQRTTSTLRNKCMGYISTRLRGFIFQHVHSVASHPQKASGNFGAGPCDTFLQTCQVNMQ